MLAPTSISVVLVLALWPTAKPIYFYAGASQAGKASVVFSAVCPCVCLSVCLSTQKLKNYLSEVDYNFPWICVMVNPKSDYILVTNDLDFWPWETKLTAGSVQGFCSPSTTWITHFWTMTPYVILHFISTSCVSLSWLFVSLWTHVYRGPHCTVSYCEFYIRRRHVWCCSWLQFYISCGCSCVGENFVRNGKPIGRKHRVTYST